MLSIFCHIAGLIYIALSVICSMLTWAYHKGNDKFCFILMLFFWYYVTAFCHVYSSTQTSWLLDSFLSMLSRLIIIILLSLGFAKLYRISIESNFYCIYKFVLFFYCFG